MTTTTLLDNGRRLQVDWPDGFSRELAARWLFDHADEARDPISGQRGHGARALETSSSLEAVESYGDRLQLRFSASGEVRHIALGRLRGPPAHAPATPLTYWLEPSPIEAASPVSFQSYMGDDSALQAVLARVAQFGLAILVGAGPEPDVVERVVERFGFVRETNYGRLFDVRIKPQPGNLAYTDQALDLHSDNPYRDPVPTLQLLHAITTDAGGGETCFVDGFAHADVLRREEPEAFQVLTRTPVRFSFADEEGARWTHEAPVLQLDAAGAVTGVRLNHRSLDLAPDDPVGIDAWYDAYCAFYRNVHVPGAAYERRLAPGDVAIFDNRRLLHGRRALSSASPRWLRGCYADVDGLAATLARLNRGLAQSAADAR